MNTLRKLLWLSAFGFQLSALAQVIPTPSTEPLTKNSSTQDLLNGTFNLASGQTMTAKAGSTVDLSAATVTLPTALTIPTQTGHAYKVLQTSGTALAWTSTLRAANGSDSVSYQLRVLYDSVGNPALDWDAHALDGNWIVGDELEASALRANVFQLVPKVADTGQTVERGLWLSTTTLDRLKYRGASTTFSLATTADKLSAFAATTSAELAGVITNETGSASGGVLVFNNAPTFTGTVAGASLRLSSLTSGRVTYATTSGLLTDSASFLTNGTTVVVGSAASVANTPGTLGVMAGSDTVAALGFGNNSFGWGFFERATEGNFRVRRLTSGTYNDVLTLERSTGKVTVDASIASTTKDTGALVVESGGLGVEGAGYFGSLVNVTNAGTMGFQAKTTGASAAPYLDLWDAGDAAADKGRFQIRVLGGATDATSELQIQSRTDADGFTANLVRIFRDGSVQLPGAVAATSKDSGTLILEGGLGVEGDIYSGGRVKVADGTAGLPSLAFDGDTNEDTGFYRIGADSIGVSTAGTLRWSWDASGNSSSHGDIRPGANLSYDLGNSSLYFRDSYLRTTRYSQTTVGTTGSVNLDFATEKFKTSALTGDITFTTSNLNTGREIIVRITADGSTRNFTFPGWKFVGAAAPASIAANKTALLILRSFGTTAADVVASYEVEP